MKHVSLTPEQMAVFNKKAEAVIFYGGNAYMRAESDDITNSPEHLINSRGTAYHSPQFLWDTDLSLMSSTPRMTLVADNLYSWTPDKPGPYHQTYDEETQRFSTSSVISLGQYTRAVLDIETGLPRISIHFGVITVKAVKYDDELVTLVNHLVDQFNQLEAENETETS